MKTLTTLLICFLSLQLSAQNIEVTGTITDNFNLPLPGVNILVKGSKQGTKTDFNGNYTITSQVGKTLVFSYLGYITAEKILTKTSKSLSFAMEEDAQALDEVVVTGYGIPREKKALGYAVSTLKAEAVENKPSKSVRRRLNGKVSGVKIAGAGGATGSGTNFKIRSKSSINGNNRFTGGNTVTSSIFYEVNEDYARIQENIFKNVTTAPLSTFSIDVDKAGYSNVRRMINNGQKIPVDAVKIEEMINYFNYNYPQPKGDKPFSITTQVSNSPWNPNAKLVKIGLKGKDIDTKKVPNSNLVFLIDVSGSMDSPNKLGLLKSAFEVLVDQLREQDKVSIVVYAGAAGVVLKPTHGAAKTEIMSAINNLRAGGSTAGGQGIELAYRLAEENFIKGGNNRIVLATDGDFNVGASSNSAMEDLIEEKRKSGVFLTVLGFGMGNYKDSKMEILADKGNGNHAYIDTKQEAKKVLGTEFFGTMYTIAKDVKIQVEFNAAKVQAYRLIGYENRLLADEDFNDDTKDAGELGSGHTVTALYEIIPVGVASEYVKNIDSLTYTAAVQKSNKNDLLTVKFRYKDPASTTSKLIVETLKDATIDFSKMPEDFQFSAAVALFGQQLRKSVFIKELNKARVVALAEAGRGKDAEGYRAEFIRLVKSY